ncbi:MAG: hypothetical protein AB7L36_09550 [Sphingomonadaceae bacterium]
MTSNSSAVSVTRISRIGNRRLRSVITSWSSSSATEIG